MLSLFDCRISLSLYSVHTSLPPSLQLQLFQQCRGQEWEKQPLPRTLRVCVYECVCVCVVLKENTAVWLVKASSLITLARWKKVERQKEEFFIRTSSVTQGVTKGEIGCRRMCCKLFFFVQLFVSWLFFSHFSSSSGPKYNPSLCCLFLFCMSAVSLLFTSLLPAVLACPVTGTHNAARAFSGTALEEPQAFPQCRGQLWRASHCPPEPDENVHRSLPAVLADQAIR